MSGTKADDSASSIRRAHSADIVRLIDIAQQNPESSVWSEAKYEDRISNKSGIVLLAERKNEIVGFLVANLIGCECEVENLAVLFSNRRQEIGRALINAALSGARERGCDSVWLEVRQSNAIARKFYQAMGFSEAGRRARYYRDPEEDALILKLTL